MRDATVREVRQDTADTLGLHLNFNSRTRVGYDSTLMSVTLSVEHFNSHTP